MREIEYHGFGKEYNMKKERGKGKYHLPYNIEDCWEEYQVWKGEKGMEILGKKIKI